MGSLGRRWHLSKVSWEVEEYRSGSRGNSPPGPKRQPDVPVGKVGGGGGLASLILVCGIGLGWEVCVCVCVCVCVEEHEGELALLGALWRVFVCV